MDAIFYKSVHINVTLPDTVQLSCDRHFAVQQTQAHVDNPSRPSRKNDTQRP
jgi:hypothetical protein